MSESFNPSHCTIESAMIKSVDNRDASITALIYGFNLKQSIYSSSFSGTLKVLDQVGTLHDFPLRAEEELELIKKDTTLIIVTHKKKIANFCDKIIDLSKINYKDSFLI